MADKLDSNPNVQAKGLKILIRRDELANDSKPLNGNGKKSEDIMPVFQRKNPPRRVKLQMYYNENYRDSPASPPYLFKSEMSSDDEEIASGTTANIIQQSQSLFFQTGAPTSQDARFFNLSDGITSEKSDISSEGECQFIKCKPSQSLFFCEETLSSEESENEMKRETEPELVLDHSEPDFSLSFSDDLWNGFSELDSFQLFDGEFLDLGPEPFFFA